MLPFIRERNLDIFKPLDKNKVRFMRTFFMRGTFDLLGQVFAEADLVCSDLLRIQQINLRSSTAPRPNQSHLPISTVL